MCGIVGFTAPGQDPAAAKQIVQGMADLIRHRGPDGEGCYADGTAALGHRRLSVIDLAGGGQPMLNEDGTLVVVFNGEIYNYKTLRARLQQRGHTFATDSDTEVLLHGYEEWGRDLPCRLRGMFAFALWDRRAGVLFCARDMFGIKPLYYCRCADGTLLFASEIKAFLDHPSFAKRLNTAQLPLYLSCQYSPGRDTFFAGVQKLLPGHFLEFSDGIVRTTRWVQPAFLPGDAPVSPAEIEEVLRGSAAAHKVADVEVAGFLSGGVDSAYLTALARPARTYTISYAEPKYARLMAKLGLTVPDVPQTGTIVHVAIDGKYAGYLLISDVVKPHSAQAIKGLKQAGVRKTVMLTGDAEPVAKAVSAELGIDEYHAGLLPGDKVDQIEKLLAAKKPKEMLAFVGDGINDAPVLSRVDVGIAMGALGSDAAIEAADVVLMDDDPAKIALAMRIARRTKSIVYQNIVFALAIKAVCLLLGALGIANMWAAIFADVGVMVLAVLNATRALYTKDLTKK